MLIEDLKPVLDRNYKMCRHICPACGLRYGDPDPRGYIDITRCEKCDTPEVKKKRRHLDGI
jgi:hypothetical protein